ncbi:rhomboid family intramembrane serine protease [Lutimonas halocynthiae]|uniref:rhomboid family intramembrane serine protease n=1 Tax=Lutimonas halocynthiae TaxID=1446477 RepID=UPI0025B4EE0A|nr:rhomboid family intramembrane serine protease [Lutimonas halocynthiae]MDN3644266.1 rhomboid family intramembrane serine protease [Lutimonas halocynthiae]
MNWFSNIYQNYLQRSIVEKIIILNVVIFVMTYLFNTLSFLFNVDGNFIMTWFSLKPDFELLLYRPWTIITYGFLHAGFFHILFNMMVLYYFGNLFLDFFNSKQFLTYLILGIISGGLIYILSYNFLPGLQTQQSLLVGASAGVMAVVIGIASHIPHYSLRFRFIGNIKLLYIAVALVVLDVVQIPAGNAGGHLAHLGGSLLGFLMTRYFGQGKNFVDWFEGLFIKNKKQPLKTVYKNSKQSKQTKYQSKETKSEEQMRIDSILDKISKSGYDTLTKEEKDYLFKAGKK